MVRISDCRVCGRLQTLPGCRVSRHCVVFWSHSHRFPNCPKIQSDQSGVSLISKIRRSHKDCSLRRGSREPSTYQKPPTYPTPSPPPAPASIQTSQITADTNNGECKLRVTVTGHPKASPNLTLKLVLSLARQSQPQPKGLVGLGLGLALGLGQGQPYRVTCDCDLYFIPTALTMTLFYSMKGQTFYRIKSSRKLNSCSKSIFVG